jgi:hypothetical protein
MRKARNPTAMARRIRCKRGTNASKQCVLQSSRLADPALGTGAADAVGQDVAAAGRHKEAGEAMLTGMETQIVRAVMESPHCSMHQGQRSNVLIALTLRSMPFMVVGWATHARGHQLPHHNCHLTAQKMKTQTNFYMTLVCIDYCMTVVS